MNFILRKRKTRFDPNADDIFTRKGSSNLQNLFEVCRILQIYDHLTK